MPRRSGHATAGVLAALALTLVAVGHASAQTASRPGPWVLDVRAATSTVPNEAAFYPPLDSSAFLPRRGFGLDLGVHVYLFDVGGARLGVGALVTTIRSTAQAPEPILAPGAAPAPARQAVALQMVHMSPQVSFNFGGRNGWSYLSAGMGSSVVSTRTTEVNPGSRKTGGSWDFSRLADVGGYNAINVGAGARWFLNSHVAFTFDLRFYRMDSGTAGEIVLATPAPIDPDEPPVPVAPVPPVATPGKMFVTAGAGLSIR